MFSPSLFCETSDYLYRLVFRNYYDLCWLLIFVNPWTMRPPLVSAFPFIQSLRYLHICLFVFFGIYNDVVAYPNKYASYTVSVRQYRILQSRFLQCILPSKPPCDLLMLRNLTLAHKGLAPSGKKLIACSLKINLYFWIFQRAYNKCELHMQGTHNGLAQ